jgi:SAM-dependent methyltransferase
MTTTGASDPTPYELPDERVRAAWRRLLDDYLVTEPLESTLARRLLGAQVTSLAELGSSTGPISALLAPSGARCVAIDLNPPPGAFRPIVQADLRALPLLDGGFDAVTAINCLYFLADPAEGVREAGRALRPGGLFLAGAPSRYHDPELAEVVPGWGEASPFDAEDAEAIVSTVFDHVEADWWEVPAYHLPDRAAVVDYLVAFEGPDAEDRAAAVPVPTQITKTGVNIWARNRSDAGRMPG